MSGRARLMLLACAVAMVPCGQAHAQIAPKPDQSFLTLMASGDRGTVTLTGRDLTAFTEAVIVPAARGVRPAGITATLGTVSRSGLPLAIGTEAGVAGGDYYVELVTARGDRVRVDLTVTVEAVDAPPVIERVDAPSEVVVGEPVSVSVVASDDQGLSAIRVTWRGGTADVRLDGSLNAKEAVAIVGLEAGRHSLSVVVTDGGGNQSDAQTVVIEAVGFTPVNIDTDGLAMTGVHFTPVSIDTDGLAMTGVHFSSVTIDTDGLAMTGVHFSPVVIDTDGLIMTGVGSGGQR